MRGLDVKRYWKLALAVVCLVAADQLTKYWAYAVLRVEGPVVLIPGVFEFSYLENRGAAFGMLQGKFWLLIPITVITVAVILYLYHSSRTQGQVLAAVHMLCSDFGGRSGKLCRSLSAGICCGLFVFQLNRFSGLQCGGLLCGDRMYRCRLCPSL